MLPLEAPFDVRRARRGALLAAFVPCFDQAANFFSVFAVWIWFGGPWVWFGAAVAAYDLASVLGTVLARLIARRVSHRASLVMCLLLTLAGNALFACALSASDAASGLGVTVAGRAVAGLGAGARSAAELYLLASTAKGGMSRVVSIYRSWCFLGTTLGFVAGTGLLFAGRTIVNGFSVNGFNSPALVVCVFALIVVSLVAVWLPGNGEEAAFTGAADLDDDAQSAFGSNFYLTGGDRQGSHASSAGSNGSVGPTVFSVRAPSEAPLDDYSYGGTPSPAKVRRSARTSALANLVINASMWMVLPLIVPLAAASVTPGKLFFVVVCLPIVGALVVGRMLAARLERVLFPRATMAAVGLLLVAVCAATSIEFSRTGTEVGWLFYVGAAGIVAGHTLAQVASDNLLMDAVIGQPDKYVYGLPWHFHAGAIGRALASFLSSIIVNVPNWGALTPGCSITGQATDVAVESCQLERVPLLAAACCVLSAAAAVVLLKVVPNAIQEPADRARRRRSLGSRGGRDLSGDSYENGPRLLQPGRSSHIGFAD